MRAIRIARYFNKREVLFWNGYDSDFIRRFGFDTEDKGSEIIDPSEIVFPISIEAVIFSDIPSNEFFEFSVYQAALKKGLRIVICEQLYKRGQLKEGVFKHFAQNCDLFLVNSLSCFQKEEQGVVKIVPPQIECEFHESDKESVREKYGIPKDSFLLFGVGYNEEVRHKIKNIADILAKERINSTIIVSGDVDLKETIKSENMITIPFLQGDDYFKLLFTADAVMVKFGFLQILESLSLGKPTIVLGSGGYLLQTPDNLDDVFKKTVRFDLDITEDTVLYLKKLITDLKFRQKIIGEIRKLNNGQLFGAKKAASEIKKITKEKSRERKSSHKKLAVLVNNELFDKAGWLKRQQDIYPLCFITAMPTKFKLVKRIPEGILNKKLGDLVLKHPMEILPHSFKEVFAFSRRKLDGLTDILPWYEEWINHIKNLLNSADEIYISEQGKRIVGKLLGNTKARILNI